MNSVNHQSSHITCYTCSKEVPRHKSFSVYDLSFCSTKCIEPFRSHRYEEERKRQEERDEKRHKHGTFTFSYGDAGAC